jgi:6-phosphogluconolactonase (cycloisomerase 2 family)
MAGWRTPADGKRLGEQMSKKIPGLFVVLALFALSLLLLNCGSSSSRPAGILYVLSQGENNVGFYSIDLGNGKLSLINNNASTCTTASSNPPIPCGFPEGIVLDPTAAVGFVLNQGAFNAGDPNSNPPIPPSGTVPSIYGYTVNSNGSLAVTGDVTTNPLPPAFRACDQPPQGVFTACDSAVAMARDASGQFLFVITQGNQGLQPALANLPPQLYVFNAQTSSTSLVLASQTTLTRIPTGIAAVASPSGKLLLFVSSNNDLSVNDNDNTVSEYSVDATGHVIELTAGGSPYTTGSSPSAVLAVQTTPVGGGGGLFVYVANGGNGSGGNSVSIFQVCTVTNATCTAQDVTNSAMLAVGTPVSAGLNPVAMTVDPTNNFLYVVNHDSSSVSGFRINPTTGALTAAGTASTGLNPVGATIHPDGLYLFVSNNGGSTISGFNVNTTSGALSNAINVTSSAQPAGLVAK